MQEDERIRHYMSKVIPFGECWDWTAARNKDGYGRIMFHGRVENAQRVFYRLLVGDIPEGKHVLHTCDRPCCVNPEHLYVGTQVENQRDRMMRCRYSAAKLNADKVRQIRELYRNGNNQYELAADFGVEQSLISQVVRGVIWKWVT